MVLSAAQQSSLDSIKQALAEHRESGPKRHFPDRLRADILALVRGGLGIEAVARATGLRAGLIYRWRREPMKAPRIANPIVPAPQVVPVARPVDSAALRMVMGEFDVTVAVARLN